MTKYSFKELYLRWFRREASAEEQEALFNQAADLDPAESLTGPMFEAWNELLGSMPAEKGQVSPLAEKVVQEYPAEPPVRKMPAYWLKIVAAAAVVGAIMITVFYLWRPGKEESPVVAEANKADKEPGREGALLTLADGSVVVLDSAANGLIAQQGNTAVKLSDGILLYEATGESAVTFNTMSTPRGRNFRLTLPDGTAVWLNAASSLKYPTVFAGNERMVEVSGEAYFEVAKDVSKPFRVKTNGQLIEVMGTRFNVQAYAGEEEMATTLLSGKVKVTPVGSTTSILLEPGFQAVSGRSEAGIRSLKADTLEVISWRDGLFRFNQTPLILILKQLERWYDVRVEGDIPTIHYTGLISRSSSLQKVLRTLEETGKARFRLEIKTNSSNEKDKIIILK